MDELQPAIVLVEPQLGDNVGSAARAMLNCGLTDLRLVNPRDGWPNPRAQAMASGAREVIDRARVFDTLEAAVADLQWIVATTGRRRDMVKDELTPVAAASEIRRRSAGSERCGVLFGRERIGLTNEEVVICDAILSVPLNPAFRSLNLGQAVLLIAYEWFKAGDETPARVQLDDGHPRATTGEVVEFLNHLEEALESGGYFKTTEMRPSSIQVIRNIFTRSELTDREVRTLHGIVTSLVGRRRDKL
ncbi:MAG: RNA methyltransferase [Acidobacteriota bacterium]